MSERKKKKSDCKKGAGEDFKKMINLISPSRYKINRKKIKEEVKIDENINVIFIGKNKMRSIAIKYKRENVALPVLSFSYREKQVPDVPTGEIFICYPQAVLLAAERNKRVDDMIISLIKHGIENIQG